MLSTQTSTKMRNKPGVIRLRELRVAHGITQQQIGDALGVPSSRISEIEHGTRNLPELERRATLWIQTITTPNQPTQHTETLDNA